jgi:hypothetical protein
MATLLHAKEHHAKDKAEIITAVLILFHDERMADKGWTLKPLKEGAGSYCLMNGNKQFHFRNGGKGCLIVNDSWFAVKLNRPPVVKFSVGNGGERDIKRGSEEWRR